MILLDSSVIIDLFRKQKKEMTFFFKMSQTYSEFCISSISHYEIGIGNRKAHQTYWENLLSQLTVLPFDTICSEIAIKIYKDLSSRNKMIDIADLLIGSTALAHDLPIATLNRKHFERIEKLEILS